MKVGGVEFVWRLVAVDDIGRARGDCGHNHRTERAAGRCRWLPVEPTPRDLFVQRRRVA